MLFHDLFGVLYIDLSHAAHTLTIKVLHNAIDEPFLSQWFHKIPLRFEEPFRFTKDLCGEKGSLD